MNPFSANASALLPRSLRKINLSEVKAIFQLVVLLGERLTDFRQDYITGASDTVNIPGQVIALLPKRPGECFLFLRLQLGSDYPSFLYDRASPIEDILQSIANFHPQHRALITMGLVMHLIHHRQLLMIRLARQHNLWARQCVNIGDFVVLFAVTAEPERRKCASFDKFKVYHLNGKTPDQRSVILSQSVFGIYFLFVLFLTDTNLLLFRQHSLL